MKQRLTFDEAKHEYRHGGVVVDSVTQILARSNPSALQFVPKEALQKGTDVHAEIAAWLMTDMLTTADLSPLAKSAAQFYFDCKPQFVALEKIVYHPELRYAGRLDYVCRLNGVVTLIDWKSHILVESVGAQLAAYREAYNFGRKRGRIERCAAVVLGETGYRYVRMEQPQRDLAKFLEALNGSRNSEITSGIGGDTRSPSSRSCE